MSTGWTVITNGGDVGWTIQSGGDGIGGVFSTSFTLGNRYQIVDLMPAGSGVTTDDLDAKPEITASEHVSSSVTYTNGGADKFYIKVQL
ncbi:MAG: F-box associated region, partial [Akkermansiaceae bacterium]|nr:F-box associated region [Akkermansiaceae bacterium]